MNVSKPDYMKTYILIPVLLSACLLMQAQIIKPHCHEEWVWLDGNYPCENYDEWVLVFEDEFDGDELDYSRWRNDYPWGRNLYCAPDVQYFTDGENIEVAEGFLKFIVKADSVYERVVPHWKDDDTLYCGNLPAGLNKRWFGYTSGMIFSRQQFIHGKFEIRCTVPEIGGLWPAFWLYGRCAQEIDVFEFMSDYNRPFFNNRKIDFTYHRKADCNDAKSMHCNYNRFFSSDMTLAPHTFSVEWDEHRIIWSVDGKEVLRKSKWFNSKEQEMFLCGPIAPGYYAVDRIFPSDDEPMSVIAGIGVRENPTASFPCQMDIDYIRVYQKINSIKTVRIRSNADIKGSTVAGKEIIVAGDSCMVHISRGEYLDLIARENIILDTGFSVERGVHFTARTPGIK
ncbi:MAG TPA: glycoside hydrolase family 16 protein [Bacteroidaceae bacterium]|nr:glycoside hydrolase family 16 protein [Bacteroidaceae bacterium]